MKVRTFSHQIIFIPFSVSFFVGLLRGKSKRMRVMTDLLSSHFSHYYQLDAKKIEKKTLFFLFDHVVRWNFSLNKYLFLLSLSLRVFVFIMVAFAFISIWIQPEKSNRNRLIRTIVLYWNWCVSKVQMDRQVNAENIGIRNGCVKEMCEKVRNLV